MRLAVVGSRDFKNQALVGVLLARMPKDTVVVSGGARGIDSEAEKCAKVFGLHCDVHPADWDGLGRQAGYLRNITIVEDCDIVVAFWDGLSRGTKHTIEIAHRSGKKVYVVKPEHDGRHVLEIAKEIAQA